MSVGLHMDNMLLVVVYARISSWQPFAPKASLSLEILKFKFTTFLLFKVIR